MEVKTWSGSLPGMGRPTKFLFAPRAIGIDAQLGPERRASYPSLGLGLGETRTGDLEVVVVRQCQRHETVEARPPPYRATSGRRLYPLKPQPSIGLAGPKSRAGYSTLGAETQASRNSTGRHNGLMAIF